VLKRDWVSFWRETSAVRNARPSRSPAASTRKGTQWNEDMRSYTRVYQFIGSVDIYRRRYQPVST